MNEIKIDKEFKELIPPLTSEEYSQLEENVINEGCRDCLVVWNGTIVDGHNRYEICNKHNIEFRVKEMMFEKREEAIAWIIRNQFGRRNLPNYERAKLALRLKPMIKKKAKDNQGGFKGNQYTSGVNQKSDKDQKSVTTDKELAKIAGVSHDTIYKVGIIESKGDEELQALARKGEISINKAFNIVRPKEETKTKVCRTCGELLPITHFYHGKNDCTTCHNSKCKSSKAPRDIKGNKIEIAEEFKNLTEEEIIGDLYDTEKEIIYEVEDLIEELDAIVSYFNRNIERTISQQSELITKENYKKVMDTLLRADESIQKVKEMF